MKLASIVYFSSQHAFVIHQNLHLCDKICFESLILKQNTVKDDNNM